MRHSHVDQRSHKHLTTQSVSDYETSSHETFLNYETPSEAHMTDRSQGVVKFFNESKGYGFCLRDGDVDVFIHANELKRSGVSGIPKPGDVLEFDVVAVDGKGVKGTNIKFADGGNGNGNGNGVGA